MLSDEPLGLGCGITQAQSGGYTYRVSSRVRLDPAICSGKPCIAGTRILVSVVLDMIAAGYSTQRVMEAYPELEAADIAAALEYASELVEQQRAPSVA